MKILSVSWFRIKRMSEGSLQYVLVTNEG